MARGRVVFFPYAGGGPGAFAPLARAMPARVECFAYCPPGRDLRDDEPPPRDWRALVRDAVDGLDEVPPGPLALYGHSLGALLALDVATAMRGAPLTALLAGARATPDGDFSRYRALPTDDAALFDALAAEYGPAPDAMVSADMRPIAARRLRRDLTLAATRDDSIVRPVEFPIIAVVGASDPSTGSKAAASWAAATKGDFRTETVDGGHYFLSSQTDRLAGLIAEAFP